MLLENFVFLLVTYTLVMIKSTDKINYFPIWKLFESIQFYVTAIVLLEDFAFLPITYMYTLVMIKRISIKYESQGQKLRSL